MSLYNLSDLSEITPQSGMPHPLDRPYQQETYNKIMASDSSFVIVKMPTGSGKSALAAQAGHDGHRSMVLTETISLQSQYCQSYNFRMIKGKGHYHCGDDLTSYTDICHASKYNKSFCQANCPYSLAKQELLDSNHASLNYSKYLMGLREFGLVTKYQPDILWLDEAHNLSNIITNHVGFSFKWGGKTAEYTNYLEIDPELKKSSVNLGVFVLKDILSNLPDISINHDSSDADKRLYRRVERLNQRILNTLKLIDIGAEYWYCKSDANTFTLKPLTARFHFELLFSRADRIILMSATIEPSDLVDIGLTTWDELESIEWEGVDIKEWKTDKIHFIKVPNVWPAILRPIHDMHGPRMGSKTSDADRYRQVEIIADKVGSFADDWSGVIHTASKEQASYLARHLRDLVSRVIYLPNGVSTEEMYHEWQNFYKINIGAICINWAFWEGVDLGDQQFCIVAKIPFASFADGYDFARHRFDAKASNRRVANRLIQGLGRIRRGIAQHYGAMKFVGICDTNFRRIWNYIDDEIKESIV